MATMASKVCYYILRHIDSKLGWSGLSLFRATPLVSSFQMVSGHGCVWKSVDFTTIFHGVAWNILIQKMLMTKWIWGICSVKNLWIMMIWCSFHVLSIPILVIPLTRQASEIIGLVMVKPLGCVWTCFIPQFFVGGRPIVRRMLYIVM